MNEETTSVEKVLPPTIDAAGMPSFGPEEAPQAVPNAKASPAVA